MNKKGFTLIETLVVTVFLITIFTFVYVSIIPLSGKYEDLINRNNDIDIVYKLYHIRRLMMNDSNIINVINSDVVQLTCNDFTDRNYCNRLFGSLELSNYKLIYTKSIKNNYNNLKTIDNDIDEYLKTYKNENKEVLILLDKTKHTVAHLKSNFKNSIPTLAKDVLKDAIQEKIDDGICTPTWVDNMGTTSTSDDITYFSGTNTCVDMNYVWYSGKLWRITAIYPDGKIKMVTQNNITAVEWGEDIEYNGSWVYQWLNEDFYATLYNGSNILINNATWNYSTDDSSTPLRPETIATQNTVSATVGLLNAYEYYNAYRSAATATNYLNDGYYWWLLTPSSETEIRLITSTGNYFNNAAATYVRGIRPAVVLKSSVLFTGNGTEDNPYKISIDMPSPTYNESFINTRMSGEYVSFDGDLYRIVGVINNSTKLVKVDYIKDSGSIITKNIASTSYFGKSTNTQNNDYWDYYLNNTWYGSISNTYKSMLTDGTYYLGYYSTNKNYKATLCKDTNLNSVTTSNCTKYTSSDTNKLFVGKVGLPRVGEMFSVQYGSGYLSSNNIWTITPSNATNDWFVNNYGTMSITGATSQVYAVRPTIYLKYSVKIKSGGGTMDDPYIIGF